MKNTKIQGSLLYSIDLLTQNSRLACRLSEIGKQCKKAKFVARKMEQDYQDVLQKQQQFRQTRKKLVRSETDRIINKENLRLGLRIHNMQSRNPTSEYCSQASTNFKSTFRKRHSQEHYYKSLENERIYARIQEAKPLGLLQVVKTRKDYIKHKKLLYKIERHSKANRQVRVRQLSMLGFSVKAKLTFR